MRIYRLLHSEQREHAPFSPHCRHLDTLTIFTFRWGRVRTQYGPFFASAHLSHFVVETTCFGLANGHRVLRLYLEVVTQYLGKNIA